MKLLVFALLTVDHGQGAINRRQIYGTNNIIPLLYN